MTEMRSMPDSRMHRQEWLTDVSHSQLLKRLVKKNLLSCRLSRCIL